MLCGAESCPLTVCKANQSSGTAKTIYLPEQRDCCLNVTDIETSVWQTGPVVSMSQPAKRGSGETHGIKVESNKPPTHRYRYHFTVSLPRSNQNLLTAPWHVSCQKHWCEAFSWWHELSLKRTEIHPECLCHKLGTNPFKTMADTTFLRSIQTVKKLFMSTCCCLQEHQHSFPIWYPWVSLLMKVGKYQSSMKAATKKLYEITQLYLTCECLPWKVWQVECGRNTDRSK